MRTYDVVEMEHSYFNNRKSVTENRLKCRLNDVNIKFHFLFPFTE